MQFHNPSEVQAPLNEAPEPEVPVSAGLAGAAELEAAEATGLGASVVVAGEAEVASVVAAAAGAAVVAKTPPERAGAEAWAEDATGASEVWAGAAELPLPLPPATATAVGQVPAGGDGFIVARPRDSTASPGFGNARSEESTVEHPFPTLATNMSGRASKAAWSLSIS